MRVLRQGFDSDGSHTSNDGDSIDLMGHIIYSVGDQGLINPNSRFVDLDLVCLQFGSYDLVSIKGFQIKIMVFGVMINGILCGFISVGEIMGTVMFSFLVLPEKLDHQLNGRDCALFGFALFL